MQEELDTGLLFDDGIQEDISIDGVSRVEELENALANVIDLWDKDMLIPNPEHRSDYRSEVIEAMEHAYAVLNDPDEDLN